MLAAYLLPAQPIHSLLPNPGRFKLSDGLLIHWNANAIKPGSEAIEAFDRDGTRVLGINPYTLLLPAKEISINDVAMKRGNAIAIAAVSLDKDGQVRPWLLQLDWNARLTNVTPLDPSNELGWIAFDESANIWGLTDYLGRKEDPGPLDPLIVVFNPQGKILKSLLNQANFPEGLHEGPTIGQVSFGLTNDKVWFWQPARHRLIVTDREGTNIQKISLPHARTFNLGGQTLLTPTGKIIQDRISPTPNVQGIYLLTGRRIERCSKPNNVYLAGIDGTDFVFVRQTRQNADLLIERIVLRELPPLSL